MKWFKDWWNSPKTENKLTENMLNNHSAPITQVDQSLQKLKKQIRKEVDQKLQQQHQVAMTAHDGDCDIFTCNGCAIWESDKIVNAPYEVTGREKKLQQTPEKDIEGKYTDPRIDTMGLFKELKIEEK